MDFYEIWCWGSSLKFVNTSFLVKVLWQAWQLYVKINLRIAVHISSITCKIFWHSEDRALWCKVGLKSNETEHMAWKLAILWPCLRLQPRRTFLLDFQCNFQLHSFNTSDLTASSVSVCSSDASRNWRNEISSSIARSNFASHLTKSQQKLTKNYREHAVSRAQVFMWH